MEIIFITGCSRSGTSILGELFSPHPGINYLFEENIWRTRAMTDHNAVTVDDIPVEDMLRLRRRMKEYKRPGRIVMEKNPRHIVHLPFLKHIFKDAKIIHIVRNGMDVSCSLKSGLCGKTWAHVKTPRWREIESKYEGIIRCAEAYKDIMSYPMRDLESIDHHQVKYEDLISNPLETMREAYKYIGLSETSKVLEAVGRIQNSTHNSYEANYQTRWVVKDHSNRVNRWKENMSTEEAEMAYEILRPVMDYYGYKVQR